MNTCETCKYWKKDYLDCEACTNEKVNKQLSGDGYAELAFYTDKDFGCTLWEGVESEAKP